MKWIIRILLLLFILLNISAFMHARGLTRFSNGGEMTPGISKLSGFKKWKTLALGVNIPKPAASEEPTESGLQPSIVDIPSINNKLILKAWFQEAPNPKGLVLFLHGYIRARGELLPEAGLFHRMGFHVLLLDFRACGESGGDRCSMGYHESDDVDGANAWVKKNYPDLPFLIYGRSMGAVAALRAVSFGDTAPDGMILEAPFDSFMNFVRNRFKELGVPSFPASQLLAFWGGVQNGLNAFQFKPVDYAQSVSCPTLIMRGKDDPYVTADELSNLYLNIPASKDYKEYKQMKEFEGVRRQSILKNATELYKEVVIRWLAANGFGEEAPSPATGPEDSTGGPAIN